MTSPIDISFDFFSDTPSGKDPDSFSPTLRRYHRRLWSKPLPNGHSFNLEDAKSKGYLYHHSIVGEFHLGSDAISNSYRYVGRMAHILNSVKPSEILKFYKLGSTIGAYIIFPRNMANGKQNINQARGFRPKIRDRFDLTLECIRRHYLGIESPLSEVLERYDSYFSLFQSFDGYVDFFLLEDLFVDDSIKFFLPLDDFQRDGFPATTQEYQTLMHHTMKFISCRNRRISGN